MMCVFGCFFWAESPSINQFPSVGSKKAFVFSLLIHDSLRLRYYQPTNQLTNQPPPTQPSNQSYNQPILQPTNLTTNQPWTNLKPNFTKLQGFWNCDEWQLQALMDRSDTGTLAKRSDIFGRPNIFTLSFFENPKRFRSRNYQKNTLEKRIEKCKCFFLFNLSTLCSPRFIRQELHLFLGRNSYTVTTVMILIY